MSSLTGTWATPPSIPGSGTSMTLTQTGSTVTGSGQERVEAGASRDFTVAGTLSGSHFVATFSFASDGSTGAYDAQLDGDSLTGKLTEGGSAFELDFTRQP